MHIIDNPGGTDPVWNISLSLTLFPIIIELLPVSVLCLFLPLELLKLISGDVFPYSLIFKGSQLPAKSRPSLFLTGQLRPFKFLPLSILSVYIISQYSTGPSPPLFAHHLEQTLLAHCIVPAFLWLL